ncbi:MAG: hypothetical protein HN407_05630 [Chloroflexi bacterium]|jgi:hypothetical protein|nr:hypothetical protein [Chloroflexota bacterium]
MRQDKNNSNKFAAKFNHKVQGAYRKVDAVDIRDMTQCGFIGRYGYYLRSDLETVRRLLQLEQLQQNRERRNEIRDSDGVIHCRMCDLVLPAQPDGTIGRPKEYCDDCESSRLKERNSKWRKKKRTIHVQ